MLPRLLMLSTGLCVILVTAFVAAFMVHPPMAYPGICNRCIMPLSPQAKADFAQWAKLDTSAQRSELQADWPQAEADYRAELRVRFCPFNKQDTWVDLGLMQDRQGKHNEAFQAYYRGFGIGSHRGPCVGGGPETAEAAARCGLMCEARGLHADACECYYTARRSGGGSESLSMTLNPDQTSPEETRKLLSVVLHDVQARNKEIRSLRRA